MPSGGTSARKLEVAHSLGTVPTVFVRSTVAPRTTAAWVSPASSANTAIVSRTGDCRFMKPSSPIIGRHAATGVGKHQGKTGRKTMPDVTLGDFHGARDSAKHGV